jgi:hypothetical protein
MSARALAAVRFVAYSSSVPIWFQRWEIDLAVNFSTAAIIMFRSMVAGRKEEYGFVRSCPGKAWRPHDKKVGIKVSKTGFNWTLYHTSVLHVASSCSGLYLCPPVLLIVHPFSFSPRALPLPLRPYPLPAHRPWLRRRHRHLTALPCPPPPWPPLSSVAIIGGDRSPLTTLNLNSVAIAAATHHRPHGPRPPPPLPPPSSTLESETPTWRSLRKRGHKAVAITWQSRDKVSVLIGLQNPSPLKTRKIKETDRQLAKFQILKISNQKAVCTG